MVLVVVRNHDVLIKGYGETFPGSDQRPDADSLLRLCSISKVFAGDLLVKLTSEGKVSLSDPLQRYAPAGVTVPQWPGGIPITLRDLATHTAGLPREVSAYPRKTPHFTFPDYRLRWAWLLKQKLISAPGTAALYSNVGFDFLGDGLATATGESYAGLLHEKLLQPLGMWDTTLFPSAEQCARLLHGAGDEGPCTATEASGASGGIYSTATDMVKLLQYLLGTPDRAVSHASTLGVYLLPMQLKSVQGLSHAGDPTGIGLGWVQIGDPESTSTLMEKTGGGAGFSTYIALNSGRHTGIFLAATNGRGRPQIDFFHEANNLLASVAGVPAIPPRVHLLPASVRHVRHIRRRRSGTSASHHPGLGSTPEVTTIKAPSAPVRN